MQQLWKAWIASIDTLHIQADEADDIFKYVLLHENYCVFIQISPKCIPYGPINKKPSLVSINGLAPDRQQAVKSEPMFTNT